MKKFFIACIALMSLFALNACGGGTPDDATVAVCPAGETFKYVYKDDKVYEFYTDDVLQSDDMLRIVQNAADNYDDFRAYLDETFSNGGCTFTSYSTDKE